MATQRHAFFTQFLSPRWHRICALGVSRPRRRNFPEALRAGANPSHYPALLVAKDADSPTFWHSSTRLSLSEWALIGQKSCSPGGRSPIFFIFHLSSGDMLAARPVQVLLQSIHLSGAVFALLRFFDEGSRQAYPARTSIISGGAVLVALVQILHTASRKPASPTDRIADTVLSPAGSLNHRSA